MTFIVQEARHVYSHHSAVLMRENHHLWAAGVIMVILGWWLGFILKFSSNLNSSVVLERPQGQRCFSSFKAWNAGGPLRVLQWGGQFLSPQQDLPFPFPAKGPYPATPESSSRNHKPRFDRSLQRNENCWAFTPAMRPKSNFCPQILGWVLLTRGLPSWEGSQESEKGREPILALCGIFLQLLLLSELLQGIFIWWLQALPSFCSSQPALISKAVGINCVEDFTRLECWDSFSWNQGRAGLTLVPQGTDGVLWLLRKAWFCSSLCPNPSVLSAEHRWLPFGFWRSFFVLFCTFYKTINLPLFSP